MHLETRIIDADPASLEVRTDEGQPTTISGLAAVFNSLSQDLGGYRERIVPGAFKSSIAPPADIRALYDHDSGKLLGRTSAGTLSVWEDAVGLRFKVELPDTSYARDLTQLVKRRDIRGCSFGFRVPEKGDRILHESGQIVRELIEVNLSEVSIVGSPAYSATSLQLRDLQQRHGTPMLDRAKRILRTSAV